MTKNYISKDGLAKLQAELLELKTVKRREAADRIEAAKNLGDLSENAEYHEAKDSLGLIEGRISQIEEYTKNIEVIDEAAVATGRVSVGSTVRVRVNEKEKTFIIVGSTEADPIAGKISNESPIGSALLGAHVSDTVGVQTPAGTTRYTVLSIE